MTDLPDRLPAHELRISDADRERVAQVLRTASGEGRLDLSELDERLGRVYAAKTYSDLEPLIRDIPTPTTAVAPLLGADLAAKGHSASGWAVAVMSGFHRAGRWVAPQRLTCVAFWGGGVVDLRGAELVGNTITIRVIAVMGGVTVIVPDEADVHVTGVGFMGGFDQGVEGSGASGGPRVVISGFAFWGGAGVKRKGPRRKR